jgi:hypothetical protein
MNKVRAIATVTFLLGSAVAWCYLESRLSGYPKVQARASSNLLHHLKVVTAPLGLAALIGIGVLSSFALARVWHFVLTGALVTPPALLPWVYSGSSGEPPATLWLVALFFGVPLGVAVALLIWRLSRCSAVQLAVQRDGP